MLVDEILRTTAGLGLTLVAGPWDARPVTTISVAGSAGDLDAAPRGALAVLTRRASVAASGRGLEAALRRAGERGLAALATYGPPTTSVGAIAVAASAQVALLSVPGGRDVSELVAELADALRSHPEAALRRLLAAVAVIDHAERGGVDAVLTAASQALGTEVSLGPEPGPGFAVPVIVGGGREGYVLASGDDPENAIACRIVADAVARARAGDRRSAPERRRARLRVIGQIAAASDAELERLAAQARAVGLAIDAGHAALALELLNVAELAGGDPAAATDLVDDVAGSAVAAADEVDPAWYVHRAGGGIVLLRVAPAAGTAPAGRSASRAAAAALRRVRERHRGLRVHCGASRSHSGARGLRTAAAEALAALSTARAERRVNAVVHAEGSSLERLLAGWADAPGNRETADELLAPLEALGPRRARTAVHTLQVYLDERGSLKRAGARLHLHPNAVSYRIRRAVDMVGVDLDDAEQRLALQLGCRAWLAHAPKGV